MTTHQTLQSRTGLRRGLNCSRRKKPSPARATNSPPRAARCRGRKSRRTMCSKAPTAASLADLFRGKSQLIVYHFMFGPDWEAGCKSCSFWADNFDAHRRAPQCARHQPRRRLARAAREARRLQASAWAGASSGSPRLGNRSTTTSRSRSRRTRSRKAATTTISARSTSAMEKRPGSACSPRTRRRASSTPTRPIRAASTCSTAPTTARSRAEGARRGRPGATAMEWLRRRDEYGQA